MENLEDTLSVNHNWLNGHNVAWGVLLLRRERALAAAAIEDCRQVLQVFPAETMSLTTTCQQHVSLRSRKGPLHCESGMLFRCTLC